MGGGCFRPPPIVLKHIFPELVYFGKLPKGGGVSGNGNLLEALLKDLFMYPRLEEEQILFVLLLLRHALALALAPWILKWGRLESSGQRLILFKVC